MVFIGQHMRCLKEWHTMEYHQIWCCIWQENSTKELCNLPTMSPTGLALFGWLLFWALMSPMPTLDVTRLFSFHVPSISRYQLLYPLIYILLLPSSHNIFWGHIKRNVITTTPHQNRFFFNSPSKYGLIGKSNCYFYYITHILSYKAFDSL